MSNASNWIWLVLEFHLLIPGCTSIDTQATDEVRQALAPSGKLKVGLYLGGPTSAIKDPASGELKGVGYELGREMARRLGVPFEPVFFERNAEVVAAAAAGKVDAIFTNATPARAKEIDFSSPYVRIELGFLAAPHFTASGPGADMDGKGRRIAVLENGTADAILSRDLKNAELVRVRSVRAGLDLLRSGKIHAFAAQKATLFEMADQLPGARVLAGAFGVEQHAIGIPKGRDRGVPFVRSFAENAVSRGLVSSAVKRAGLRGTIAIVD